MLLAQIIIGCLLGVLIVLTSWRSLGNPRSHGFYRFFGFVATLIIILLNLPYWVGLPYTIARVVSWIFLATSLIFVLWGVYILRRFGGREEREDSPETLGFENTAQLVTTGLFRYIRHPMYSSLLFLAWGGYLKHVSLYTSLAVLGATIAFVITARIEEKENLDVFGEEYSTYVGESRMFIPFLF